MEIQSAFNSGIQGFQKATEDASQAASDIVSSTILDQQAATENQQAIQPSSQINSQQSTQPNLTESVVNLKVAEHQAKGSAEVIKTADEALGTLLDVRV
ncbi:hypothetical protein ACM9HF_15070 [Colwellia sp. RE-S-Sl-9]